MGGHSDSHRGKDDRYHPKDAIGSATSATLVTGTAGALISGCQNALARENRGLWGLFTKTGGTVAIFAAMGGTHFFIRDAAANLREKDDTWNTAIGGFFAGSIIGMKHARLPSVIGFGLGLSVIMSAFHYGGNTFKGTKAFEPEVDEVSRLEAIRTTRRRSFEETIAAVGEGRGIYGPGYAERRRALLKEKYGIEVPATPEKPYAT